MYRLAVLILLTGALPAQAEEAIQANTAGTIWEIPLYSTDGSVAESGDADLPFVARLDTSTPEISVFWDDEWVNASGSKATANVPVDGKRKDELGSEEYAYFTIDGHLITIPTASDAPTFLISPLPSWVLVQPTPDGDAGFPQPPEDDRPCLPDYCSPNPCPCFIGPLQPGHCACETVDTQCGTFTCFSCCVRFGPGSPGAPPEVEEPPTGGSGGGGIECNGPEDCPPASPNCYGGWCL